MSLIIDNITELQQTFFKRLAGSGMVDNSDTFPNSQFWLVRFPYNGVGSLETINNQLPDVVNYDSSYSNKWEINPDYFSKHSNDFMPSGYYLLAESVTFPGDVLDISREIGIERRTGLVKGMVTNGRIDFENVVINFIETNGAFVDFFLRPWLVLVSYKSLKIPTLKLSNIDLICFRMLTNNSANVAIQNWNQLLEQIENTLTKPQTTSTKNTTKYTLKQELTVRKILTVENVVPQSIDNEEFNYTADKVINRQVSFKYSNYYMHK